MDFTELPLAAVFLKTTSFPTNNSNYTICQFCISQSKGKKIKTGQVVVDQALCISFTPQSLFGRCHNLLCLARGAKFNSYHYTKQHKMLNTQISVKPSSRATHGCDLIMPSMDPVNVTHSQGSAVIQCNRKYTRMFLIVESL